MDQMFCLFTEIWNTIEGISKHLDQTIHVAMPADLIISFSQNNLAELEELIEKWRAVSQQGLQDLHEALPEPKPNFSELLQHLGVDYNLVKFDPTEETFNL